MDTDSFLVYIKTEDIYIDIAKMKKQDLILQIMNETDNYLKKNKKLIGLLKDELGGKIMTEITALRPKTYGYLTDENNENKKAKVSHKKKTYI